MAEPQPPSVREGDTGEEAIPAAAEDRKAADAMSKLDGHGTGEDDTSKKAAVDDKALGDAMKGLGVGEKKDGASATGAKKEVVAKVVKVDQADVNLLVEHLDLTKAKATELLKAHDADAVKAMTAFVKASA